METFMPSPKKNYTGLDLNQDYFDIDKFFRSYQKNAVAS